MPQPLILKEAIEILANWAKNKKTGSIQFNFFNGVISNANLTQCIKGGMCDVEKNQNVVFLPKK